MDPETQPESAPSLKKRMVLMLLIVGGFLVILVGFNIFKGVMIARFMASQPEPAQTVSTAEARMAEWQPSLNAVGTLRAVRGADLGFELAGTVAGVEVQPGSEVRAGQLLVAQIDSAEVAQLRQLQAQAALSKLSWERAKREVEAQTISQADYDSAAADHEAKDAAVQQQAALLAKKHLVAPFAGRVGLIATSPGAYLDAGKVVATLQQLDPLYVDFYLPQRNLSQLSPGQKVQLTLDAFPGQHFDGKVSAVNPKVDGSTRNIQVEATVSNPRHLLVPGMFAGVDMEVGKQQAYLTLPQTAITYNPYGATVFIVKKAKVKNEKGEAVDGLVAEQVFVTPGPTRGDQVSILKGLSAGAEVVTSGGLKLKNGTPLKVDNSVRPADEAAPAPQEQ